MSGRGTVGLVHTVPALADTFHRLLLDVGGDGVPGGVMHIVDPSLLATAVETGVDEDLHVRVAAHVRHLESAGADAVMVTCSSIGEVAAAVDGSVAPPVLRVDVPMAEEAVRLAAAGRRGHIVVLATLESTLGPTGRLVGSLAREAPRPVTTQAAMVGGAAAARSAGNHEEHARLVARAVDEAAQRSDVVVLAQASMASAVGRIEGSHAPALTSPESGARRLADVLAGVRASRRRTGETDC